MSRKIPNRQLSYSRRRRRQEMTDSGSSCCQGPQDNRLLGSL